uniref:serine C-palmitoyltransferase n=1 Tax=Lygus hesperus TaxID=30085 RepID=A0A0A9X853_LYGHE
MVFSMGFGTNSTGLPVLARNGTLIISDSINHASIIVGSRASGAKIAIFKHDSMDDLEKLIRKSIIEGQPRTHRPWKSIIIIVEGIYSMEGEFCNLPKLIELKKKYKCYLYVDEAHSIGCIGRTGRGVCEHFNIDTKEVDLMMGTFTKSFGSVGGYIAGDKHVIQYLRSNSEGYLTSMSIPPAACQQIISALRIINGKDGTNIGREKLRSIHENSLYFRKALIDAGLHVLGDEGSPVIPVLLYMPSKILVRLLGNILPYNYIYTIVNTLSLHTVL